MSATEAPAVSSNVSSAIGNKLMAVETGTAGYMGAVVDENNRQPAAPGEGSVEFSNRSRVSKDLCDVVDFPLLSLNANRERRCLGC